LASPDGLAGVLITMRLVSLVLAALLTAQPVAAQGVQPAPVQSGKADTGQFNLPISLDNIREALARPPVLLGLDRKPDFSVTIEEAQRLEELFRSLEMKMGPAPPGGLYAYEQQRLLFNPTDHPLSQPYAAFSGGELITLAVEGLITRWITDVAKNGLSNAEKKRAEKNAREEITRAIAQFCAEQPDRSHFQICWMGLDR
jgi:hypothetical protein